MSKTIGGLTHTPIIADNYNHLKADFNEEVKPKPKPKPKPEPKPKPKPKPEPNAEPNLKEPIIRRPWTTTELAELVDLRANKVCDKACAKLLNRTPKSCRMAIWGKKLLPAINAKRCELGIN